MSIGKPRRGRPRKDPDLAVRHGVLLQPKFARIVYREIKAAAAAEGISATAWLRRLAFVELARIRKENQHAQETVRQ